ncbi:helix-turn-helix domain-containing protein [Paenibacillus sp. 1A_MP2]|uniref:helix-turn-helix domain-containing protein n=1 Tax=Paenibacillus sp. 1A_MP2 TaxID=3457495 RepID=UPI003FCDCCFC
MESKTYWTYVRDPHRADVWCLSATFAHTKSCELLKNSQHKVSLIAELVGYRDVDSFYAVFKRITGETPQGYRRNFRAKPSN